MSAALRVKLTGRPADISKGDGAHPQSKAGRGNFRVTHHPQHDPERTAEIATLAPGRSRFGLSLPLVVGVAVYAPLLFASRAVLSDPDTYWHIATGRWIIAHGAVPRHDVFSFSMPGASWTPPEWLAEIVIASLYDHFGWAALVMATALSVAAALAILLRALLKSLAPVHALIATALAAMLAFPHLLARPHS